MSRGSGKTEGKRAKDKGEQGRREGGGEDEKEHTCFSSHSRRIRSASRASSSSCLPLSVQLLGHYYPPFATLNCSFVLCGSRQEDVVPTYWSREAH